MFVPCWGLCILWYSPPAMYWTCCLSPSVCLSQCTHHMCFPFPPNFIWAARPASHLIHTYYVLHTDTVLCQGKWVICMKKIATTYHWMSLHIEALISRHYSVCPHNEVAGIGSPISNPKLPILLYYLLWALHKWPMYVSRRMALGANTLFHRGGGRKGVVRPFARSSLPSLQTKGLYWVNVASSKS